MLTKVFRSATTMTIQSNLENQTIAKVVTVAVADYLEKMKHHNIDNLYKLVMAEVEPALLETVMKTNRFNQSKLARILGLSRGTTRSKLRRYFGDKYAGSTNNDL
jgi:Fis family transcriptional regulator, factor for inversion stimulation protein